VTQVQDRPYAFLLSQDGHLWQNHFDGQNWVWFDGGTPPGGGIDQPAGVTAVQDRPFAYILDIYGRLWSNSWTGKAWQWHCHGARDA
jgi:hypothetical protein